MLRYKSLIVTSLQRKEISVATILFGTIISFYSIQPVFLSPSNIDVLLRITPELGIVALGVTLLMIGGEFDLSVGSVFGFIPMVTILLIESGIPPTLAIVSGLLISTLVGLTHGVVTVKTGIPSFITTLGGLLIWRGVSLAVTGGLPKYMTMPPEIIFFFSGKIAPFIHMQMIWFFALAGFFYYILERTKFGNWIYATGGRKEVARAMGVNTDRVKIVLFTLSSLMAGMGGIIQSIRLGQALPNQGDGLEFDAIAVAVIGGTSLFGGSGTILGTVIAEYLSRIIENGLIIIRAPSYYFRLYIGLVIVIAVTVNIYILRRSIRSRVES